MCDADFADELIACVENGRACECGQSRGELVRKDAEKLQEFQKRGVLRARRSVLHLDRDRDALSGYADRVHAFRTDLADQTSPGFLDQYGVETIGSPEKKWMRSDSPNDAGGHLVATIGSCPETRECQRERPEWQPYGNHPAAVHHEAHLAPGTPAPLRDLREGALLYLVSEPLVAKRRPRLSSCECEHAGMLPRAVVVQSRGYQPCLMHEPYASSRQWLVSTACEIALLEADRLEHPGRELDVLRLAAVRCARERELLAAPPARVEAARLDERKKLKGFRAGAPHGWERRIARAAEHCSIGAADDCVHAMPRFDRVSACDDHVELILIR
jgi:hypothetical protein